MCIISVLNQLWICLYAIFLFILVQDMEYISENRAPVGSCVRERFWHSSWVCVRSYPNSRTFHLFLSRLSFLISSLFLSHLHGLCSSVPLVLPTAPVSVSPFISPRMFSISCKCFSFPQDNFPVALITTTVSSIPHYPSSAYIFISAGVL